MHITYATHTKLNLNFIDNRFQSIPANSTIYFRNIFSQQHVRMATHETDATFGATLSHLFSRKQQKKTQ
jgi:hypothetical protein